MMGFGKADPYGHGVRQLMGGGANAAAAMDFGQQNASQCAYRNLRGECANPNVLDKDGQMMSWKQYDNLRNAWKDPRAEHQNAQQQWRQARNDAMRQVTPWG